MEYGSTEMGSARKRHETREEMDRATNNIQDEEDLTTPYIQVPVEESHTRSLLKGFTWRIVASLTTVTIAFFVVGEVGTAFQIGIVEFFAKIGIYYIHERIWAKIQV